MSNVSGNYSQHPVLFLVKNFLSKLMQQPGIYPIKHYKKTDRFKKGRSTMLG